MTFEIPLFRSRAVRIAISLLLISSLIAPTASARYVDTIIQELISLRFRTETFQEYEQMTRNLIDSFGSMEEQILLNPSLDLNETETAFANSSLKEKKILAAKEAATGFVGLSTAYGNPIALVSFNEEAYVDSLPSKDREKLEAMINLYRTEGRSCIHCGIISGTEVIAGSSGGGDMVLITDGHGTIDRKLSLEAAEFARSHGIRIYAIGLGNDIDETFLRDVSEITGGEFYRIRCTQSLYDIYTKIFGMTQDLTLVMDTSKSMEGEIYVECSEEKQLCGPRCILNSIVSLIEPLYATLIILVGFYLLFVSGTPEGRVAAKSSLGLLIASMCIITLSPFILTLFFGISHGLTQLIFSQTPRNAGEAFYGGIDHVLEIGKDVTALDETHSTGFVLFPYLLVKGLSLALYTRYFVVVVLSVLFPFVVLLYPLPQTRGMSRVLAEQLILWTSSQIAMAFVFVTTSIGMNMISSVSSFVVPRGLETIMGLSGMAMIAITPFFVSLHFRDFLV